MVSVKLVSVLGSPHGMQGTTGQLLVALHEGAEAVGASIRAIRLGETPVAPCRGCDACHKIGVCPLPDGFEDMKRAMVEADGVILASPNYILSVTGQLKAFMDRCSALLHCGTLFGKHGVAVVTAGAGCGPVEDYLSRCLNLLGCYCVGTVSSDAHLLLNPATMGERLDAARRLGGAFVRAIEVKATFPAQDELRRLFAERMRALVRMHKDAWPYEYEMLRAREA